MVLEKARQDGFLGASLEAKVLLHVPDAQLASSLAALQGVRPFSLHSRAFHCSLIVTLVRRLSVSI